jgi:hypothetical protein
VVAVRKDRLAGTLAPPKWKTVFGKIRDIRDIRG